MFSAETLGTLVTLTALETVLGIDNIIFLTILVGKLPRDQQAAARRLGLVLALAMRICLLLTLSWLASLTAPLVFVFGRGLSGRDLVLLVGGAFLAIKSAWEIYHGVEGEEEEPGAPSSRLPKRRSLALILVQIVLMDIVFSLDSVITAVGLAQHISVMVTAMVFSMLVMLGFARAIGDFVNAHPSMKVLALSFLVLVGAILMGEGTGRPIPKSYVYASMVFAFVVELLNIRMRRRSAVAPLVREETITTLPTPLPSPAAPRPAAAVVAVAAPAPDAARAADASRAAPETSRSPDLSVPKAGGEA
ncbi:MAG TPA: TerC family protein [Polyangiaceae bacterium]|nr:TerC family protein [Polyangiaceae bacterium]